MAKIFISYRREDSDYRADRLAEAIRPHLKDPDRDLFIDIDSIPLGVDFVEYLESRVAQCDVLLALIGPDWVDVKDPVTGVRRLDKTDDFVRVEIAAALRRGIRVVPVLLDGAPVPHAGQLPDDLQELARRNGVEMRRISFASDVERLVRGLGIEESLKPAGSVSPDETTAASGSASPARGDTVETVKTGGSGVLVATLGGLLVAGLAAAGLIWSGVIDLGDTATKTSTPIVEEEAPAVQFAAMTEDKLAEDPAYQQSQQMARERALVRLQQALKTLGHYRGGVDGDFGPLTNKGVQDFARSVSLTAPDILAGPVADIETFVQRAEKAAKVFRERDNAAWDTASDTNTVASYNFYLKQFSEGQFVGTARSRIDALNAPKVTTVAAAGPAVPASAGAAVSAPTASISTSRTNLAALEGQGGAWFRRTGRSVEQSAPDAFWHYFIVVTQDSSFINKGAIVRGRKWDNSEAPMWDVVYGYSQSDGDWYKEIADTVYLGSSWVPEFATLSDAMHARGGDDHGNPLHNDFNVKTAASSAPARTSTPPRAPSLSVSSSNLSTLEGMGGAWWRGLNRSVDQAAPKEFNHYFIIVSQDSEYITKGAIVKGYDWDNSAIPQWNTVYGYAKGDGDWFKEINDAVYLGPTWRPEFEALSKAMHARGGDSHGNPLHNDMAPKKSVAPTAASTAISDAALSRLENAGGTWWSNLGRTVEMPAPSQFGHYFIVISQDSEYISKGAIVKGYDWDNSAIPQWEVVYGYTKGDGEWFKEIADTAYLGSSWKPEYKALSDAMFSRGGLAHGNSRLDDY